MRICHILGVPPSDSGSQTPALLPQVQDSTLLPHYPRPIPSSKPGSQPQSFSLRPRNPDPTILQTQELTPQTSSADQGLYLRVERVVIICVIVVITGREEGPGTGQAAKGGGQGPRRQEREEHQEQQALQGIFTQASECRAIVLRQRVSLRVCTPVPCT